MGNKTMMTKRCRKGQDPTGVCTGSGIGTFDDPIYMKANGEVGGNRMKAVILAGGFGTRISEESHLRPKPMVEIGGKPILWHIMTIFGA